MTVSHIAKLTYVKMMRGTRSLVRVSGVDGLLRRRLPNPEAHWLLSLLAIHDIDAMIELDVPWWTYAAIEEVDRFLTKRPNARVFEYGSGASTIWLGKRAKFVTSVEHDEKWFPIVSSKLECFSNVTLEMVPPDAAYDEHFASQKEGYVGRSFKKYVTSIEKACGPFDVIVIDGRSRVACMRQALTHLAPGGLIVFDNSRRREYCDAITSVNGEMHTYRGRVPSLPYFDQTTLIWPNLLGAR